MPNAYIGFYWTLPVNWAGFRRLPTTVDAAAAKSRTIRYQRELARRYVAADRGTLLDEIAFIDVQPDRPTDMIRAELLAKVAKHAGRATLLYVRFEEIHLWRRNRFLPETAQDLGLKILPLPPDPTLIDGELFDPILHFKQWRKRDEGARTLLKLEAGQELRLALAEIPEGNGRWQAIAERLNGAGTRTSSGGSWTAENVRKHTSRL